VIDEVFQANELVKPYRVAPSIDLEENSIFCVFDDNLIDVDVEELNVVLSSSGLENVDKEDITTLKSAMKLITIQLRTKMKILTKYVVKPYFYNVILKMIFWNMKYIIL
jgi:hypothetical protein